MDGVSMSEEIEREAGELHEYWVANAQKESTELSEWVKRVHWEAKNLRDDLSDIYLETRRLKNLSIYRIPASQLNHNMDAYTPKWVSFGPYHHGKEHLKPMEEHKQQVLINFLRRCKTNIECLFQAVGLIEPELLGSYSSMGRSWLENRVGFMKMMILDGCFMLEILRRDVVEYDYPEHYPVLSRVSDLHVLPFIRREMLMLENQLPIILLETLASFQKEESTSVKDLILRFWYLDNIPVFLGGRYSHMLQLYKKSLVWHNRNWISRLFSQGKATHLYQIPQSATGLSQSGIIFSRSKTSSITDISFSRGILRLPHIVINDSTESVFLNLLAFERLHVGAGTEVTAYVHIMSSLIQDADDVSLLRSQGIITNASGNDTTTALVFNSLSKDIIIDPRNRLLYVVTTKINAYCNSRVSRWRYSLIATYIREWPILSFFAATVLFILTTIQTVYSVFSAYHK